MQPGLGAVLLLKHRNSKKYWTFLKRALVEMQNKRCPSSAITYEWGRIIISIWNSLSVRTGRCVLDLFGGLVVERRQTDGYVIVQPWWKNAMQHRARLLWVNLCYIYIKRLMDTLYFNCGTSTSLQTCVPLFDKKDPFFFEALPYTTRLQHKSTSHASSLIILTLPGLPKPFPEIRWHRPILTFFTEYCL